MPDSLAIDTGAAESAGPSARTSPASEVPTLTTFPNPFADEQEPGLLPSLLSKVKSTFAVSTTSVSGPRATPRSVSEAVSAPPTEAQLIAEAARSRAQQSTKTRPPSLSSQKGTTPSITQDGRVASIKSPPEAAPTSPVAMPPALSMLRNAKSSSSSMGPPPMIRPVDRAPAAAKRVLRPGDPQWRLSSAAPASVKVTPVTSLMHTRLHIDEPEPHHHVRQHSHGHGPPPLASSSRTRLTPNAHRLRRGSVATIPDSPTSVSLSAMIAANTELDQNYSYVPGFPVPQDDTRSVRSVPARRSGGVSKLIRRMRGEGLSKHYWMDDERCKECYDCKSTFTAWRRKHHCRICGQIFCSRCASNIINARRFGQDGMVRVCNLCVKVMEDEKDDDEDDRRSINSVSTSVRLPPLPDRPLLDTAISPDGPWTQSPFAASQLFMRHPNESLTAIDEGSVWDNTHDRPYTPNDLNGSEASDDVAGDWPAQPKTAAPFRRAIDEDGNKVVEEQLDDPPSTAVTIPPDTPSPGAEVSAMRPRVAFPRTDTIESDGFERRITLGRMDSNVPLIGLRTRLSSRASQAGLSAMIDQDKTDGLFRARSHSFATDRPEMRAPASLQHLSDMLAQTLARERIPHDDEWHRVLCQLLLRVSRNLQPDIRNGDSVDARSYVKIKKIPGGKISDSEYVDGIVITKNVAHKAMPRRLVNPRIMVMTYPLNYHRGDTKLESLAPILTQERDYLRNLCRRIIDFRPHIVLAHSSASRIALDYLLEANIAVARSVKASAIQQVARWTQTDIVSSMDRLALEYRLGRCADFCIQSFEHALIPGRRKTIMRFEGCRRDRGGTILLRGADLDRLKILKVATSFMSLVAYHLQSEVVLYSDEHNIIPPRPRMPVEYEELLAVLASPWDIGETPATKRTSATADEPEQRATDGKRLTYDIAKSLQPYLETVLSPSAAVRFPPPVPLARMAELDRTLNHLRQSRDDEEAAQILQEETKTETSRTASPDLAITPTAPSITVMEPNLTGATETQPSASTSAASLLVPPARDPVRDPYRVLRYPEDIAKSSALARVEREHAEQLKAWQLYVRRHTETLRPEDYQNVVFIESLSCEGQEKPCVEPERRHCSFYQSDDQTLGQFLEALALSAAHRCPNKSCERLLLFHFRLLVHGRRRLQIAMDQFPCPSPGHEEQIITWSYCRECATPSPTTVIREETWRMSWGAYLEHCFYPPRTRAGFACPHDAHTDQIRYFAHRNLAIRIINDGIDVYEPLCPSVNLQIKPETKVLLRNQEYESVLRKTATFFSSVLARLRSFNVDIVAQEKTTLLRQAVEAMLSRAVADREEVINLLNRTYKLTQVTDVLALNAVLQVLQDKVVQWDLDFIDIEKAFMPTEKDLRNMTASHLKRLFVNQDVFGSLDRSIASMTVSEVDEKENKAIGYVDTPEMSIPPTPEIDVTADGVELADPVASSSTTEAPTPVANGLSLAPSLARGMQSPDEYDSDSTISAVRRNSPGDHVESGVENDAQAAAVEPRSFVSRLPRRSRPAPSIADLVKRFQESVNNQEFEPIPEPSYERPTTASANRHNRFKDPELSDVDDSLPYRPRLRRGRTEQPPARQREQARSDFLSDGDRSYAAFASRTPSTFGRRSMGGQSRAPSYVGSPSPSLTITAADGPAQLPPSSLTMTASTAAAKPRVTGKGKMPRRSEDGCASPAPAGVARGVARRSTGGTNSRVTSIARHFDRLSREADRDRQKRLSAARIKRARPVGVTKAKVQVFDNVRDAFKDEFDSDSSEADNEEDDEGSDASAGSNGRPRTRDRRKSSSPKKKPAVPLRPAGDESSARAETAIATGGLSPDTMPASSSTASIVASSVLSDANTDLSLTERLQIQLPPFDTSAPLPSVPVTPQLSQDAADDISKRQISQLSQMSESELSSGGGERSSILKTLTGLWAFRAGDYTPLEYPLSASEHIFADSRVIIRENEPTSIIAFTLSSKAYRDNMRVALQAKTSHKRQETFMPDEAGTERGSVWDIVSMDEAMDAEDGSSRLETGTHLKYDFESGSSTIFCRIFFAEQFAALRTGCQCEDSFVESLSRCVQFDASGGKSGSAFLKTKDDRFIAKEISRLEMDALTKFAPAYFEYMRRTFQGERPSVLAKIYGFFKIGYRNAVTGRSMRMNVLVMENLFYERRFSKIYDLKGSTRNRLIQATGKINEVLLDENLMEIAYRHPLYLHEHAKRTLLNALHNDTLFLSNLNVMDYSLVVGVDSDKRELVIGIVDYIRTFTWDKKLESWVKDSGFLGGAGKGEPTIVTPKQYKTRFRTAMERFYFPAVPDRWSKIEVDDTHTDDEGAAAA